MREVDDVPRSSDFRSSESRYLPLQFHDKCSTTNVKPLCFFVRSSPPRASASPLSLFVFRLYTHILYAIGPSNRKFIHHTGVAYRYGKFDDEIFSRLSSLYSRSTAVARGWNFGSLGMPYLRIKWPLRYDITDSHGQPRRDADFARYLVSCRSVSVGWSRIAENPVRPFGFVPREKSYFPSECPNRKD